MRAGDPSPTHLPSTSHRPAGRNRRSAVLATALAVLFLALCGQALPPSSAPARLRVSTGVEGGDVSRQPLRLELVDAQLGCHLTDDVQ